MPARQTQEEFIEKSKKIFGEDTIDYSKVKYIDSCSKVILVCKTHGDISLFPSAHLSYERFCQICAGSRYDTDSFIIKAKSIHGDKFDYSKIIFKNIKEKVIVICENNHEFKITPDKHIRGQGCYQCMIYRKKDKEYFLSKTKEIHGDKYDYSKIDFDNFKMNDSIEVICKTHNTSFYPTGSLHINNKTGCPTCHTDSTRLSQDEFIDRANVFHNNKYDYSKVVYINMSSKINIVCDKHGLFTQRAGSHLKSGCMYCNSGSKSMIEAKWLDSLNIPKEHRNVTLKHGARNYRPDGYDPVTNTIYEFYGDYWHGNPQIYKPEGINKNNKRTFSNLYEDTIKREEKLKALGYNLVTIWESEFKATNKLISPNNQESL